MLSPSQGTVFCFGRFLDNPVRVTKRSKDSRNRIFVIAKKTLTRRVFMLYLFREDKVSLVLNWLSRRQLVMKFFKKVLRIVVLLIFLGFVFYGIKLGDFVETKDNGSVLCLSCIGIG